MDGREKREVVAGRGESVEGGSGGGWVRDLDGEGDDLPIVNVLADALIQGRTI